MTTIVLRRVALAVPALIGVSILVFLLMQVLPGDPASALLAPGASAADLEALRRQMGLNLPLPVRYVKWLVGVLQGNLGYSYLQERTVAYLIRQAWENTAILAAASALFGLVVGTICGVVAGAYRGRWVDRVLSVVSLSGLSTPSFWLAILLLILLSSQLDLLPAAGTALGQGPGQFFRHLALPALSGGLVTEGFTARVTRASMIETYDRDFVTTLRANGLRGRQILWHVFKNALSPILTVSGLQVGYLLGGQVLIETVFSWPGMGLLVYNAIIANDIAVVQGAMLVIAATFVVINLLVDILQTVLNPSLRRSLA